LRCCPEELFSLWCRHTTRHPRRLCSTRERLVP
jgi:hypothetical protein